METSLLTRALAHATLHHMGNSKFEHIVATAHEMNGQTVTADTDIAAFETALDRESTFNARAADFNNALLRDDDFFGFPQFFEFSPLEASTSSNDSTTTFFSSPDTSDESQG